MSQTFACWGIEEGVTNCCYFNLIKCKNTDFKKKTDISFSGIMVVKTRHKCSKDSRVQAKFGGAIYKYTAFVLLL